MKSMLKRALHRLGFDLRRYDAAQSESARFITALRKHDVNLIFDVGANVGHFGRAIRDMGYGGRIVSFEPLAGAWEALFKASRSDSLWDVAPRAAIGGEDGFIEMHLAKNSVSSSALQILDAHSLIAPDSAIVGSESVPLRRLDTIGMDYLKPDSVLMVKIDTQGFEDKVLQGACGILEKAVGLQLELSLIPLYEGQLLYDQMIARVKDIGFELWGIDPVFVDNQSGRLLQVDATFYRRRQ